MATGLLPVLRQDQVEKIANRRLGLCAHLLEDNICKSWLFTIERNAQKHANSYVMIISPSTASSMGSSLQSNIKKEKEASVTPWAERTTSLFPQHHS